MLVANCMEKKKYRNILLFFLNAALSIFVALLVNSNLSHLEMSPLMLNYSHD